MDMSSTYLYAWNMSKMIQVEHAVERPTMREWLEQVRQVKRIPAKQSAAQALRELRDTR